MTDEIVYADGFSPHPQMPVRVITGGAYARLVGSVICEHAEPEGHVLTFPEGARPERDLPWQHYANLGVVRNEDTIFSWRVLADGRLFVRPDRRNA